MYHLPLILAFSFGAFFGHVWDVLGDIGEAFWAYSLPGLILIGAFVITVIIE